MLVKGGAVERGGKERGGGAGPKNNPQSDFKDGELRCGQMKSIDTAVLRGDSGRQRERGERGEREEGGGC